MQNNSIMQTVLITLLFGNFLSLVYPVWSADPLVLTKQGIIRGLHASDGNYSMFMGIPFALVNKDNPFGDAHPGPIFDGIFEAHDDSGMCPQIEEFNNIVTGNLDCLHVNVYVPNSASASNRLPVLVWIYGGGFRIGSAGRYVYGPQYLVRHDVILVTLNYRVGPYGFMCLDTPSVPGNSGLKDQRRGLRWVQENIAAFGGDTNSITVFGESAGAMSLEFHILSPGSNGLFHRAILQSGSALVEHLVVHSRQTAPIELVEYLGFRAHTMEDALEILKNLPTNDVIVAARTLGITFKPCVEKVFEGVGNAITDLPDLTLASGQYESVPMIVGYNSDEQLAIHLSRIDQDGYFDQFHDLFYDRINRSFEFKTEEQLEKAAKRVQEFYVGTKSINQETVFELIDFDSDAHFLNPIERSIKYHTSKSDLPIYQYVFAYSGEVNFVKRRRNITEGGAAHADDIGYLFKQSYLPDENSPEDQLVIDRMTTMWTNFVKYGDPTPKESELLPVRWPLVSDAREYLWIDSDLKIDRKPFHSRIAFWDLFFDTFGEYFRMVWW